MQAKGLHFSCFLRRFPGPRRQKITQYWRGAPAEVLNAGMSRIYLFFRGNRQTGDAGNSRAAGKACGNRPPGGAGPISRLQPCAFPGGGVSGSRIRRHFFIEPAAGRIARGLGESVPREKSGGMRHFPEESGGGSGRERRQIPLQLLCRVGAQEGPGETNLEKWLAYEARLKAAGPERVGFLTRGHIAWPSAPKRRTRFTTATREKNYKKLRLKAFWCVQPQVCVQVRQAARHSA